MLSTSEIPLTEASPTAATMMVSAMPMVIVRICSKKRGTIRALRYLPVNILSCMAALFMTVSMIATRVESENHVKTAHSCRKET